MTFYSKFVQYYDSIFPFKQPAFDFVKNYTTSETTTILDVGCGTGHYTAAFSKAGFKSTGVDLDDAMIDYAKQHHPHTDFHAINMLDIKSLNQKFDLIYCIGNTLAHLNKYQLQKFIHAMSGCLAENGVWIFQVRNWDYVLLQHEYEFPILTANNRIQFVRTYTNISTNSLYFNTRLTDDDKVIFKDSVCMTPLTSQHYLDVHHNHAFQLLGHFADFKRTPFDPQIDSAQIFVFQSP